MTMTRRGLFAGMIAAAGFAGGCVADRVWTSPPTTHKAVPTIVLSATKDAVLPMQLPQLAALLQAYVEYLTPVWGVRARIVAADKSDPAHWNLRIVHQFPDDEPVGALAYHDFNTDVIALPYAIVQTANLVIPVTVTATHELGEMLVNPGINNWSGIGPMDTDKPYKDWGGLAALEIADPVEQTTFQLHDHPVSNFVYPSYFEPWRDGPWDQLGVLKGAREISPGGYQILRMNQKVWEVANLNFPGATTPHLLRCARYQHIMRAFG